MKIFECDCCGNLTTNDYDGRECPACGEYGKSIEYEINGKVV